MLWRAEIDLSVKGALKTQRSVFAAVAKVDLCALVAMAAVSSGNVHKRERERARGRSPRQSAKAARVVGAGHVTVARAQVNSMIHAALGALG